MKVALVSGLFLALVGCGGSRTDTATATATVSPAAPAKQAAEPKAEVEPLLAIPKEPAPEPDELIATIGVASPAVLLAEVGGFLDAVSPGMGAAVGGMPMEAITGELMGVALAGVDDSKPMWVLAMDPRDSPSTSPVVVVAAVKDRAAFDAAAGSQEMVTAHDGGYGAVGAREAMAIAAPFALSSLARKPAPERPTVTIFVARSVERFGTSIRANIASVWQELEAAGDPQAASVKQMMESFLKLVEQTDVATVSLDLAGAASLLIDVIPKQDSAAARLFARQPRAQFDGLGRYPGADMSISAHLDWSSFHEVFAPFMEAGNQGYSAEAQAGMRELYEATYGMSRGETTVGMSLDRGRLSVTGQWGVSDPKQAERKLRGALRKLAAVRSSAGPIYQVTARPTAFRHRRATVGSMTMRPTKGTPREQREAMEKLWGKGGVSSFFSVVGSSYLMTMGSGSKQAMRAAIERAKADAAKPPPLPAHLAKAVATARARKESFLTLVDLASALAAIQKKAPPPSRVEPLAIGVGFADGHLSVRFALPLDQARQLASQGSL
jgi:hypothetical protein